jgi:transposase
MVITFCGSLDQLAGCWYWGRNNEEVDRDSLKRKFDVMLPMLDERQRRLYLATEAESLGRGGITLVAKVAGVSRDLIQRGVHEPDLAAPAPADRVRRSGGGRKKQTEVNPELAEALNELIDPDFRGDPESPLRWTLKSTRQLASTLTKMGHPISHTAVADILGRMGFSLQALSKQREGKDHPDRDAQFKYLNKQVKTHQKADEPVISVDCKKKELIGNFKNGGREWQPAGEPEEVNTHDFPDPDLGKAVPYGVYDVSRNEGWVNVGRDHDTSAFAVESIKRWWYTMGQQAYPTAKKLLITADAGGSNGYRVRLWKVELAAFARETGLKITVCHLPPGTSKWNKIEHRLFSHITMNWRGRPLTSHETVVNLIGSTTTATGLRVEAVHDYNEYEKGIKIADAEMKRLPIKRHAFHGEWNYTLTPSRIRRMS